MPKDEDPFAPAEDAVDFRTWLETADEPRAAIEEEWLGAARAARERADLDSMPAVLNSEEVATYLRMSDYQVREHLRRGVLPGFRVGDRWRVERSVLRDWIEAATTRPQPPTPKPPRPEPEPKRLPPRRPRRGEF